MLWGDLNLSFTQLINYSLFTATYNNLQKVRGFTLYQFLITMDNIMCHNPRGMEGPGILAHNGNKQDTGRRLRVAQVWA